MEAQVGHGPLYRVRVFSRRPERSRSLRIRSNRAVLSFLGVRASVEQEHLASDHRQPRIDEETGEYVMLADRWHTCFFDCPASRAAGAGGGPYR